MQGPDTMVFAICHEVGNLLAAIRLHGDLLDADAGRQVSELSARSGALLSLVRPLLDPAAFEPVALEPARLLSGLRTGLDDPQDPRLDLGAEEAIGLPDVIADGDALHHLLLSELLAGFELLGEGERLRASARPDGQGVAFELCGGRPEREPREGDRLAGRTLSHAVAAELLGRVGGTVRRGARDGRQQIELIVPFA
jgi:hypothetical protein